MYIPHCYSKNSFLPNQFLSLHDNIMVLCTLRLAPRVKFFVSMWCTQKSPYHHHTCRFDKYLNYFSFFTTFKVHFHVRNALWKELSDMQLFFRKSTFQFLLRFYMLYFQSSFKPLYRILTFRTFRAWCTEEALSVGVSKFFVHFKN